MVMLRPKGKAYKIAAQIMKVEGVKIPKQVSTKLTLQTPYLQH